VSRFTVSARRALQAEEPSPSHAFIALLRCIEALSRLTGEPYSAILERVAAMHRFGTSPGAWPRAIQIRAAASQLVAEREAWLGHYRTLVAARKLRKSLGDRRRGGPLGALEQARERHNARSPHVGYWGWRALRDGPARVELVGVEPRHAVYRLPFRVLIDLRRGGDPTPSAALAEWCTAVFRQPGVDAWRSALLADARVWTAWRALDDTTLALGVRSLSRAGVRSLWLTGVAIEPADATSLGAHGLVVRELCLP
jgi:hypothetical protein